MSRRPGRLFWAEVVGAVVSAGLAVLTLLWHDWIEVVFEVEPDGGDGSLEWMIVAACVLATVTLSVLARRGWRQAVRA